MYEKQNLKNRPIKVKNLTINNYNIFCSSDAATSIKSPKQTMIENTPTGVRLASPLNNVSLTRSTPHLRNNDRFRNPPNYFRTDETHVKAPIYSTSKITLVNPNSKQITAEYKPQTISNIKNYFNNTANNKKTANINSTRNSFNKSETSSIQPFTTRNSDINSKIHNNHNNHNNNSSNSNNFKQKQEKTVELSTLFSNKHIPITLNVFFENFQNFEKSKFSNRAYGAIKSYAVNTHRGIIRTYNEDRVSIILNILKPNTYIGDYWPKCAFFGVFDGHGGAGCADYLKDYLHQFIIQDASFPRNPEIAIQKGFEEAEKDFIRRYALNDKGLVMDRSGSCALVALVVGDCRGVLINSNGQIVQQLTRDHKPNDPGERKRITENGGSVYQSQTPSNFMVPGALITDSQQILLGPYRIFPGRLSVSRSFGDIEAKIPKLGGLPNVLISKPEITKFEINSNNNYLILGCDGIFDQLSNEDVKNSINLLFSNKEINQKYDEHSLCGAATDFILKSSMYRKSLDNVTCLMVSFNFPNTIINKNCLTPEDNIKKIPKLITNNLTNTSFHNERENNTNNNSNNNNSNLFRKSINSHFSETTSNLNKNNSSAKKKFENLSDSKKNSINFRSMDLKEIKIPKLKDLSSFDNNINNNNNNNKPLFTRATELKSPQRKTIILKKDDFGSPSIALSPKNKSSTTKIVSSILSTRSINTNSYKSVTNTINSMPVSLSSSLNLKPKGKDFLHTVKRALNRNNTQNNEIIKK